MFAATDQGGSGVAAIHYTTDSSTPTLSSPLYTSALTLTASRYIKLRAFDQAGNAGPVIVQQVKIDHLAPAVTITAGRVGSQSTGNVRVKASGKDSQSGVTKLEVFVDGHRVATKRTGPFVYTWIAAHAKKGAHKLTVRVTDKAGNRSTRSIRVVVR